MLDKQTAPLEIAKTVLQSSTISAVRTWGLGNSSYLILDRWALNTPAKLQQLEQMGEMELMIHLSIQQETEAQTLNSESARQMKLQGLSDTEILLATKTNIELRFVLM